MDKQWVWGGIGGQERMHRVDKMDAEGNSQEGKLEIWKEGVWWGLGSGGGVGEGEGGLTRVEKIMVLNSG